MRVARLCVDADEPVIGAAAFHCQQAAEKLIKSLLVIAAVPFRKVHDLDELADAAERHFPQFAEELTFVRPMTPWAVTSRYPTLVDAAGLLPSRAELVEALTRLEAFAAAIRQQDPASKTS